MKVASLNNGSPDGELVLVSRDLSRCVSARDIAPTLQAALDAWAAVSPKLEARYAELNAGSAAGARAFDPKQALSPLPRAYQWVDGSVYAAHMERMGKWRGLPVPEKFFTEPFMYQGASDGFLAPTEPIPAGSEEWGIDYEAEIAIVTDRVPFGVKTADAGKLIRLVMICNDVSLRNLIPPELEKGFGFVQSKPASAFSPVAVTPDELGADWKDCKLGGALRSFVNGTMFGDPEAGAMVHGFDRLVAHAAMTRSLCAGSIIGSGTVASSDDARGTSCIVERRVKEMLATGAPVTPFLRHGDRVKIEMLDRAGKSIFGAIEQDVRRV